MSLRTWVALLLVTAVLLTLLGVSAVLMLYRLPQIEALQRGEIAERAASVAGLLDHYSASLEAQLMAQEAQLRMLRTQIDPHFLFNSLNSISALTSQDPKAARRMTLELASFFRQSLGMEAHRKVTLGEEMIFCSESLTFALWMRIWRRISASSLLAASAISSSERMEFVIFSSR